MPLAILLLFGILQAFLTSATRQREIATRTEVLSNAQIGLERMTRDIRQANWVYFTSSQIVDIDTLVRAGSDRGAVSRHVRYDCSGVACIRMEGPATTFPPSRGAAFEISGPVIGSPASDTLSLYGRLAGRGVFEPRSVDPATGVHRLNYLDPDYLRIRIWLRTPDADAVLEIEDGVSLRNATRFAA